MPFKPNRRSFIIATGLTALASTSVLGANDTLRIGVIGAGGRMRTLLDCADKAGSPRSSPSAMFIRRGATPSKIDRTVATTHLDYHEVLEQNVDAVLIASPDHWHVRMAADALAAGKDVYLEKPVTHTLEEGAVLTKAVRSSKHILQCGMQQRSWTHFRDAVDLIQGGSLGRVLQVRTYWWQNYQPHGPQTVDTQALDWKLWLGIGAGPALQRREILPLALVLEFWRRRNDRSLHSLDRRRALGDEVRRAARSADARRQIRLRTVGLP